MKIWKGVVVVIKKLVLHKYARLFLNNIEHLELTPENNIQILLGRNGSGKTSVLAMLNPLPADIKKEFREDGYKLIEIEHHRMYYVLSSNYVARNKHSFKVDGVEHNPGGTRKVQLELVYEHFKISPDINQILIGMNNFTIMPTVERKYWFTELSTVDYTFAVTLYNRLKQRYRDIVGGVKLVQEEIVKAEAAMNSDINLDKLIMDKKHLDDMIRYLLSHYTPSIASSSNDTILNDIVLANTALSTLLSNVTPGITISKLNDDINVLKIQIGNYEHEQSILNKEIASLDKYIADEPLEDLEKKEKHLNGKIKHVKDSIDIDINLSLLETIIYNYRLDYSEMIQYLNMLSEYSNVPYSTSLYSETKQKIDKLAGILKVTEHKLSLATLEENRLAMLIDDSNKVECDNCHHVFYFKYDLVKHTAIKKEIDTLVAYVKEITAEHDALCNTLELLNRKRDCITQVATLMLSRGELKPVWEYIIKKHEPYHMKVSGMITEVDAVLFKLERWETLVTYGKELSDLQLKLSSAKEFKKHEITASKERQVKLEKELMSVTIKRNLAMSKLTILEAQRKVVVKIEHSVDKLKYLVRQYNKQLPIMITDKRNNVITELVNTLKSYMVDIDQIIHTHQQQKNIVMDNKSKLVEYLTKEKLLNIVLKELSPAEGIIAKSMNSFLGIFINEMNYIINTVWSYRMELLPCEISEENDLDYKFRVLVDDSEMIEDVSKLSTSMQEIVNLAYRIVFIKYLNVQDVPLFLDEFGRTMDTAHQISAYNTIEQIMADNFVQIFIVSHFESMYGRFSNADISILDTNNIDIGGINLYNTVLKIE